MKKSLEKIFFVFLAFVVLFDIAIFTKKTFFENNLINIDKLSKNFMDNYFEEISSIADEDKKNILIVVSKNKIKDSYGATRIIEAPNHQFILQYNSDEEKNEALRKFSDDERIQSVEENIVYKLDYNSWGIEAMSLDSAIDSANYNISYMQPVTVAVIDSGCDVTLFNKYYPGRLAGVYDVLNQSPFSIGDEVGHGTLVSSVVADATPSNVKLFPVSAGNSTEMYETDIIAAVNYIVNGERADVINMSMGATDYGEAFEQAIDAANQKNIIVVASSGNEASSVLNYPASFDSTISVGSVDSYLKKSDFSSYGEKITFVAPGSSIKAVGKMKFPGVAQDGLEDFDIVNGTSFSCPHAAAAVAILKGYNKNLSLEDTIEILKDNAIDLGDEGWDQYYGYGLISFDGFPFCDGIHCGEYGVYASPNSQTSSIEVTNLTFTQYNYYSLTNILGSSIKVSYADNTSFEFLLSNLPNVEISGYDPYTLATQTVTIKLGDLTTTVDVTNPSNYESGWEYSDLLDGKVEITGYKDHGLNIDKLYVPELIDSKQVVAFADNFRFPENGDVDNYTSLYLPDSFDRIGNYALSYTKFEHVYGSSPGIEVGAHAFEQSLIITIEMPLTKVEDYAFYECPQLVFVKLYEKYKEGSDFEFSIGEYAFYDCSELVSVELLNSGNYVENIGAYAFYGCDFLSFFNLRVVYEIGEYAFSSTVMLRSVDLTHVSRIGTRAFEFSGISDVSIDYLELIESDAFVLCKNLKKVSISSGTISNGAFLGSSIETLILNDVDSIAEDAFAYNPIKSSGSFSSDSGKYKTIRNLGIVDSSTNKLIIGFAKNFNIPEYITEIGDYAFQGNSALERVIIPSTVTRIGSYAFSQCVNLSQVYMLGDSIDFGDNTFNSSNVYIYVYSDSPMKQYVIGKNLNYRHIVPDGLIVSGYEQDYRFFSKVDTDALVVKLIYYDDEFREEEIPLINVKSGIPVSPSFGYEVIYQNDSDSFQPGDTQFTVSAKDSLGHLLTLNVPVTLNKAIPSYILPDEVNGLPGQTLSEIALPSGFEWMDGSQTIDDYGEFIYKARYIPDDKTIYEIVENIDIKVVVTSKEIINPEITIQSRKFNFFTSIPLSSVSVSNLDSSDFSVVSAISMSPNAGQTTAFVVLRLSDEKFETHAFSNGLQEKEFKVNFEILKADFNSYFDLGEGVPPVYIGDQSEDVSVLYDGEEHSIKRYFIFEYDTELKFMDENGDYVLDDTPKYSEVGVYRTYYMLHQKNFNDYYGYRTLVIEPFLSENYYSNEKTFFESNVISKVHPNIDWDSFISNLSLGSGFRFELGSNETKEIMYTGQKIKLIRNVDSSDSLFKEYTVSVKGDLNGGGTVNATDMISLRRYIKMVLNEENVDSCYILAGDFTGNGKINANDMIGLRSYIKEVLSSDG